MQAKCEKVSVSHLIRRNEKWIRMSSNRKEEKDMTEKLDCNITPFIQLSLRLNMNCPLIPVHPWWALEVPGPHCHILHRWCMPPKGYRHQTDS